MTEAPMIQTFVIEGRLPGLNEYTGANRSHAQVGAKMKRAAEVAVAWAVKAARLRPQPSPVVVKCTWVEATLRRDPDNVCFAKKFVLDVLQPPSKRNPAGLGIIAGDGRRDVLGFVDVFAEPDNSRPRIEVVITSMAGGGRG